jgi:hypothetical protein
VIDHQVRHQVILGADGEHVIPVAEVFIDAQVVDHGEAVVGAVGVERQHVHARQAALRMLVQPVLERLQGLLAGREILSA